MLVLYTEIRFVFFFLSMNATISLLLVGTMKGTHCHIWVQLF